MRLRLPQSVPVRLAALPGMGAGVLCIAACIVLPGRKNPVEDLKSAALFAVFCVIITAVAAAIREAVRMAIGRVSRRSLPVGEEAVSLNRSSPREDSTTS